MAISQEKVMAFTAMLNDACRNWRWVVLRGIVALAFGIMAFIWPAITLAALVLLWAAYAFADGVFALIAAFRIRDRGRPFWAMVIVGVLGIAAGVVGILWPGMTALVLLMFIAAWAFFMGIFQIVAAVRLRKEIEGELLLGLSGVLSLLFGLLLFLRPGEGALAVVWLIGAYAVFFGVLLIILGIRLKGMGERMVRA
jgi:uncharacterized membrane protein HdeD (DUF308 family)